MATMGSKSEQPNPIHPFDALRLLRAFRPQSTRWAKTSPVPVIDHKSVTMLGSCPFQRNGPKFPKGEKIARPELRPRAEAHSLVVPVSRKRARVTQSKNFLEKQNITEITNLQKRFNLLRRGKSQRDTS
jgi:hypothetical protein